MSQSNLRKVKGDSGGTDSDLPRGSIGSQELLALLLRGSGIAFLVLATGTAVRYLSQMLFAQWMGAAGYGAYAFALSWAELLAVAAALGLTLGVLRFVPQYLAVGDMSRLVGLIRRSRQFVWLAGIAIACIGSLWVLISSSQQAATLIVALWMVPLLAQVNLHTEIIRGTRRILRAYAPQKLLYPVLTLGIASGIFIWWDQFTATGAVLATIIALASTLAVQMQRLKQTLPDDVRHAEGSYETNKWLRVSFPLFLISGFVVVLAHADILMIGILIGPRDAGIYAAATKTAALVGFVLVAVNTIAAPSISACYAQGDTTGLRQMTHFAVKLMFWPALAGALFLVLFGDRVLRLFGEDFVVARWPLTLLALAQLVNVSVGPVGYLISLTGRQNQCAAVYASAAGCNIVLNVVLIPRWGMLGAAVATSFTMIMWNVWLCVLVWRHLGFSSLIFTSRHRRQP